MQFRYVFLVAALLCNSLAHAQPLTDQQKQLISGFLNTPQIAGEIDAEEKKAITDLLNGKSTDQSGNVQDILSGLGGAGGAGGIDLSGILGGLGIAPIAGPTTKPTTIPGSGCDANTPGAENINIDFSKVTSAIFSGQIDEAALEACGATIEKIADKADACCDIVTKNSCPPDCKTYFTTLLGDANCQKLFSTFGDLIPADGAKQINNACGINISKLPTTTTKPVAAPSPAAKTPAPVVVAATPSPAAVVTASPTPAIGKAPILAPVAGPTSGSTAMFRGAAAIGAIIAALFM